MHHKKQATDGSKTHSHGGHMWMMAVCFGVPVIGLLTIAILGINLPSLETILLLICPIGMIGMMYFMHRNDSGKDAGHSCASSKQTGDGLDGDIESDDNRPGQPIPIAPKRAGSLEA